MRASIDVATRVSAELSSFIEHFLQERDHEDVVSLADVRRAVQRHLDPRLRLDRLRYPIDEPSMLDEVESLVEDFGEHAPAVDFVRSKASESLSRIIEHLTSYPVARGRPTLGGVREAMARGVIAQLAGDGIIDPDEDQTLLMEIDALIDDYGRDQLAEEFVRFE